MHFSHLHVATLYLCCLRTGCLMGCSPTLYLCCLRIYILCRPGPNGPGSMGRTRWARPHGPASGWAHWAGPNCICAFIYIYQNIYIYISVFAKCKKISIRSDVILSALDLHDDATELTPLGGTVMSLPAQHPLILCSTPPAMWGKGSGVFSSHKG